MDADFLELMTTTLEAANHLPLGRRARVYRALSRLVSDERIGCELRAMADSCLTLESRCRALDLSFVQKTFDK